MNNYGMNILRKIVVLFIIALFLFQEMACGTEKKREKTVSDVKRSETDGYYYAEKACFDGGDVRYCDPSSISCRNGCIYTCEEQSSDKDDSLSYNITCFNTSDGDSVQFKYDPEVFADNITYVIKICADDEGNIYILERNENREKSSNSEGEEDGNKIFNIVKLGKDGKELWRTEYNSAGGCNNCFMGDGLYYIDEKGVLICSATHFILYSEANGSIIRDYDIDKSIVDGVFCGKEDKIYVSEHKGTETIIKEFDLDEGAILDSLVIPEKIMFGIQKSYSYVCDMFLMDSKGIYEIDIETFRKKYICSYTDINVNRDNIIYVYQPNENNLIILLMNLTDQRLEIKRYEKQYGKDEKEVLTMGGYDIDSDIRNAVIDFNASNNKYRIEIIDYSIYDVEEYGAGILELNKDIISGTMPDILLASSQIPIESYISKRIIEPLDEYLKNDPEISYDDYLPNVMNSFKTEGKMYSLVPVFRISSVVAKTSEVKECDGWSIKKMRQIARSRGIEDIDIFGPITQGNFIYTALELSASDYVSLDNHTCNFIDGRFKELLEYADNLPKEITAEEFDSKKYVCYRNGKALCNVVYMSCFDDYRIQAQGFFDEPITLIGFPGTQGNGSVLVAPIILCMSANSHNKDVAWDFMSSFMKDEFQNNVVSGFPVKKDAFYALADKATKSQAELNGSDIRETLSIGQLKLDDMPLTDDEVENVVKHIESIDNHTVYNMKIAEIVLEESSLYFEKQRNVDEVCDTIQSRVTLYLEENH
ncbi:hypothetical protein D6853_01420 [Butyrivibrio sp. X503]|uniref:hypothetical protein n=1 Tax=Butyrivibrio sp. X503 TaxID=2364878 RepID=UPI000EA84D0D|nr:hypothetical protein [Butyrivibrio sp. X503]RKM58225.1 hypothetical protein D6853_01420 [Butyrivibrio sp. X503]